jgi:hypothetical protein
MVYQENKGWLENVRIPDPTAFVGIWPASFDAGTAVRLGVLLVGFFCGSWLTRPEDN